MCVARRLCFCALQAVEEVVKNAFRVEERVSQFEPLCIIPLVRCELAWRSSTVQKFVDEPLHQGLVGRQRSVQEAWAQLVDAQSTMSPCSYCKHHTMPYALSTRNFFTCTSKLLCDTKCVPLKKFFSRIMSHSHASWSDLPPFPHPERSPSVLLPLHSDEQPLDPRTAERSGRLAILSSLTGYEPNTT